MSMIFFLLLMILQLKIIYERRRRNLITAPNQANHVHTSRVLGIKKVAIKSIFYVSPSTNDSFCRLKHE